MTAPQIQRALCFAANEIQSISAGVTPVYDKAGNMTTMPKPDSPTTRIFATYDAWNRLAKVYVDTNDDGDLDLGTDELLASHEYDGAGRVGKCVEHRNT